MASGRAYLIIEPFYRKQEVDMDDGTRRMESLVHRGVSQRLG